MAELTEQQKRFADFFVESGNASDAYIKAGYKVKNADVAKVNASRLLTNANVIKYIVERNKQLENDRIADMAEVKEFWSNTMRDVGAEVKDRLKASEYIAKTNAAFVDRHEHSGELNFVINRKRMNPDADSDD